MKDTTILRKPNNSDSMHLRKKTTYQKQWVLLITTVVSFSSLLLSSPHSYGGLTLKRHGQYVRYSTFFPPVHDFTCIAHRVQHSHLSLICGEWSNTESQLLILCTYQYISQIKSFILQRSTKEATICGNPLGQTVEPPENDWHYIQLTTTAVGKSN